MLGDTVVPLLVVCLGPGPRVELAAVRLDAHAHHRYREIDPGDLDRVKRMIAEAENNGHNGARHVRETAASERADDAS